MNSKGQMTSVGTVIIIAIAVIVALTLLTGGITSNVATVTQTNTITNAQVTYPNGSATTNYVTLVGQAVSSVVVTNRTNASVVFNAGNYTIQNYVVNNGQLEARLVANNAYYALGAVNVSYVSEPFGYDTNAGGRAITSLIIVLCALALAVVVISYVIKNDIFNF